MKITRLEKIKTAIQKGKKPHKKIQHFLPWYQQAALVGLNE